MSDTGTVVTSIVWKAATLPTSNKYYTFLQFLTWIILKYSLECVLILSLSLFGIILLTVIQCNQ